MWGLGALACSAPVGPVEVVGSVSQALDGGDPDGSDDGGEVDSGPFVDGGGPLDGGSGGTTGTGGSDASLGDGGVAAALLNEIEVDPPGGDDAYRFLEVRCAPGAALDGLYVLTVGARGAETGVVTQVVPLGGHACGTNGLVFVHGGSGGHSTPTETSLVVSAAFGPGGALARGPQSFLLVRAPAPVTVGTDLDDDDDGRMDWEGGSVVDSIALRQEGDGGTQRLYGGAIIATAGGTLGALTRFPGNDRKSSSVAWYGGAVGGNKPEGVNYDLQRVTGNFPTGGGLTPGAANAPRPPGPTTGGSTAGSTGATAGSSAGATGNDTGPIDGATGGSVDEGGCSCRDAATDPAGGGPLWGAGTMILGGLALGVQRRLQRRRPR